MKTIATITVCLLLAGSATAEVRMNAIVWGQGARMKREALEMLMAD